MKHVNGSLLKTIIVSAIASALTAGCSQGGISSTAGTAEKTEAKPPEPITLTIAWTAGEDFAAKITDHPYMKKNFPHITFKYQNINNLDKQIAANDPPDIMNVNMSGMVNVMKVGMHSDLTALIQKNKFDLARFPKDTIDSVKRYGSKGEIYGLPDKMPPSLDKAFTPYALLYNKDIFDKFNVPYPKNNMTWNEVIDLAGKLNRQDGGVQYKGLTLGGGVHDIVQQVGLQYTDSTGKVNASDPGWVQAAGIMKKAYDVLGYNPVQGSTGFRKDQNVAMFAGVSEDWVFHPEKYEDVNWDMATFPKVQSTLFVPPALGLYVISPMSKNKDAAFQVLAAFLSDEMQKERRVNWDDPLIKKRNGEAVKSRPISAFIPNEYTDRALKVVNGQLQKMLEQGNDVNTIVRELQEQIKQTVEKEGK